VRSGSNVGPAIPAPSGGPIQGVALDDEVLRVDGEPVSALTIDAIRARLRRAGDRVRIELRRGDATRTALLALRALI
jgi:C-terminal processing protease CtpA/Prc